MRGLDPRVLLVGAGTLALWIGLLPAAHLAWLGMVWLGALVGAAQARISPLSVVPSAVAAASFVVLPLGVGVLVGSVDPARLVEMAARASSVALVAALVVHVQPPSALLGGASALGLPDLLVQVVSLVLRYLDLLRRRSSAMLASARARGYGPRSPRRIAVAGAMVGSLLVSSFDRADRVHQAMLARGYTGRFPSARELRLRAADVGVGLGIVLWCASSLWWLR
jgi:cobalt/nickel transport system permease protein